MKGRPTTRRYGALLLVTLCSFACGFQAAVQSTSKNQLAYSSSSTIEPPSREAVGLEQHVRNLVITRPSSVQNAAKATGCAISAVDKTVTTWDDFEAVVLNEQECLTVVRFHAPWCRSCKRIERLFERFAMNHSSQQSPVKFVDVSIANKELVQHLQITAIPYGHIYHPVLGKVEELNMNSKYFTDFTRVVDSYVKDECSLPRQVDDATEMYASPYKFSYAM